MGGRNRQNASGPWRLLLPLLCVLLIVVAGAVQVAHTHPGGAYIHPDCSLCAAAQVTIQMVQTPIPVPSVRVVAILEAPPLSITRTALSTFALFTRPPPAFDIVPA